MLNPLKIHPCLAWSWHHRWTTLPFLWGSSLSGSSASHSFHDIAKDVAISGR
jgi:hypothetical protein